MLENKNKHLVLVDNLNLEYFFCHHFGLDGFWTFWFRRVN